MNDTILTVRDLRVTADTTGAALVDGVSFDVARGESVGIVGASGSGKSLTLRAIMGLPPSGVTVADPSSVAFGGDDGNGAGDAGGGVGRAGGAGDAGRVWRGAGRTGRAGRAGAGRAPRLAMIFQDPRASLDPLCGVVRQVAEVVRCHGTAAGVSGAVPGVVPNAVGERRLSRREARAAAADLLVSLGLPESLRSRDRYPGQLSGGQCQRVGIAIALATRPDILLCDEPTTALDVTVQCRILDLLADRRDRLGLTLLFVTHNLGVAARLCPRLIVMDHGRIVEDGPTSRILTSPQAETTKRLIAALPSLKDSGAHTDDGPRADGGSGADRRNGRKEAR